MKKVFFNIILWLLIAAYGNAQNFDERAQLRGVLANSYISINPGYIHYPFTQEHIEPGRTIDEINVPHGAARVILGHEINPYLSAQFGVMRPVKWVEFKGVDGKGGRFTSWINAWNISLKPEVPIGEKLSIQAEIGANLFSRRGINWQGPVINDAHYWCPLFGGGFQYKLDDKWDVLVSGTYLPKNDKNRQPYTYFLSAGIKFNLRPLPEKLVQKYSDTTYFFPRQMIQVGAAHDFIGYKVNTWFVWTEQNKKAIPIFWLGDVLTRHGFHMTYQRNVFHTRKAFSLDWGGSISYWRSQINNTPIFTMSLYPVLRFWMLRTNPVDLYFTYSAAGPSFISVVDIDGLDTGEHFTFQDFLGIGTYFGKNREFNAEFKIMHYSNGGLFTSNPGVDVPLMMNIGYAF